MSLAIQVDDVVSVLMDDGWHPVADKSFSVDAYEFLCGEDVLMGGGSVDGGSSSGASWREPDGSYVACPLPAIKAVRHASSQA
jgi:hypothetical protein